MKSAVHTSKAGGEPLGRPTIPWRVVIALMAVLSLVASACGSDEASDSEGPTATEAAADDTETGTEDEPAGAATSNVACGTTEDELLQAAIDEGGDLTVYTGWLNAETVNEAFMEAYPEIQIELARAASGITAARFASEYEAGVHAADILELGDTFTQEEHPEWFQPMDAESVPNLAEWPEEAVHMDGLVIDTAYNSVSFIMYNTELTTESEVPDSWEELLDERWQGDMVWVHPSASPTFMNWANYARQSLGDQFLSELAAQQPRFTDSLVPAGQEVAAGAAAIGFPAAFQALAGLKAEGAPIDAKLVSEPFGTQATMSASIAAEAPHPCAARLFMNWLMTEEGQAVHCSGGATGIISVDEESCFELPSGFESVSVEVPEDEQEAVLDQVGDLS